MRLKEIRQAVVETGHRIFELGLVNATCGNISIRDAESGLICIKPSGVPWMSIQPEDVVVIDMDGRVVEGKRKPSIETPMHTTIYRNFQNWLAVVHSHSLYATGFASALLPIPPICITSAEIGGEVPCAPYCPPGSRELADVVAATMQGRQVILLGHHGVRCCARTLDEAVFLNILLEDIAHLALIQRSLGSQAQLTPARLQALGAIYQLHHPTKGS
jgi:L-ribulose-5-phosphate 4-epimerase